jgi:peptide/nickel transport system permease protein
VRHRFQVEFTHNTVSLLALTVVLVFLMAGLLAPFLGLPGPTDQIFDLYAGPSIQHPFGTDNLGRDVFSEVVWGTRVSLTFGVVVALISAILGTLIGAASGYFGGLIDDIASRLFEIILAVPGLFVIILIVTLFGSNLLTTMTVVGAWVWPSNARIMRAQVLSGKQRDYVTAATILGASDTRILFRHVIPNSLPPLIANSTLQIGFAIALEAGLSFIGLGDANVISWGQMLNQAQSRYATAWWMAVFPGVAISILVLGFNLVGDAITRVLNPQFSAARP